MTKIKLLQFDTYLAMIENAVDSYMFKNLFIEVDGVKKDATEDGDLSCAFFVSSVLFLCKYIDSPHATVESTVKKLKDSGWQTIDEPVVGSVVVWKKKDGHSHIGFYVGDNKVISNSDKDRCPKKTDWKFDGNREIDMILWRSDIIQ